MKKILSIIGTLLVSMATFADDIAVSEGDCGYIITSQDPKQVTLSNGRGVESTDFVVPNSIHLNSASNEIYDVTWTGFGSTSDKDGSLDGLHSYSRTGYVHYQGGNTVSCRFKAKGSVTFYFSLKIPNNCVYRPYMKMSYDSKLVGTYQKYDLTLRSYYTITKEYTVTPGDDELHTMSFYLFTACDDQDIHISVSINQNESITEGDYAVTEIGQNAFDGCASLQTITLPESITDMGADIFLNCSNLTAITSCNATPPAATSATFNGVDKENTTLYVPASSVELYKNAEGWKEFLNIVGVGGYAENVTLDKTSASIFPVQTLIATATTDKDGVGVVWTSSDENIATVKDGVITAVAPGKALIIATADDGGNASATFTVTVKVSGDVNGDGLVNIVDVAELVSVLNGKTPSSSADVNVDDNVNLEDLNALVNIILEKINLIQDEQ